VDPAAPNAVGWTLPLLPDARCSHSSDVELLVLAGDCEGGAQAEDAMGAPSEVSWTVSSFGRLVSRHTTASSSIRY
jgi:hypothetical protein